MILKNRFSYIQIRAFSMLFFIMTVFLCLNAPYTNGQDQKIQTPPKRVLFVGNSYTYFENLPHIVSAMAEKKGIPLIVQTSTAGGATLEHHWKGERFLTTVQKIESEDYDAVILQDQSRRPILEPEKTIKDIGLFCTLIKKKKAVPYLFLTWASKNDPKMQGQLTETYMKAARINNAKVIPVGLAWELARKLRHDIPVYSKDGQHPSKLGAYLTACVFFGILTGESPLVLSKYPMNTDNIGDSNDPMGLNEQDKIFCQKVAEQTTEEFYPNKTINPTGR